MSDNLQDKPVCPECGGTCYIDTPALKFLHEQLHAEPWGNIFGLGNLPYVLFPRVAKLMEDFVKYQREAADEQ